MEHTILLFGFDSLPEILAAQAAAGPFGTEVRAVGPRDCGLTIGELAAGKTAPEGASPVALNGRMAVLCGLEEQMNDLLPALRGSGRHLSEGGADDPQPELDAGASVDGAEPGASGHRAEGTVRDRADPGVRLPAGLSLPV